jgi:predicted Zn-dependent protease with MMP-like domain
MKKSHDELINEAYEAMSNGQYEEAEALGRRALMVEPQSVEARFAVAAALMDMDSYQEARPYLEEAVEMATDDAEIRANLGIALFETCEFARAEDQLTRALQLEQNQPEALYWMALCLERHGEYAEADRLFKEAASRDAEAYPLPTRISRDECLRAVEEAIAELPEEFHEHAENLAITIDDLPGEEILKEYDPPLDPCLLGLFVGIPLPEKSYMDGAPQLPDTVYLYQRNLERFCHSREDLIHEIRVTLFHEIGHYVGFDEDDLAERGLD